MDEIFETEITTDPIVAASDIIKKTIASIKSNSVISSSLPSSLSKNNNFSLFNVSNSDDILSSYVTAKDVSSFIESAIKDFSGVSLNYSELLKKYEIYESIYQIQIIRRIVKTYLTNIFQKNITDNTFFSFDMNENAITEEQYNVLIKDIKYLIEQKAIDVNLKKKTVKDMLVYGKAYIEIVDIDSLIYDVPVQSKLNDELKQFKEKSKMKFFTEEDKVNIGTDINEMASWRRSVKKDIEELEDVISNGYSINKKISKLSEFVEKYSDIIFDEIIEVKNSSDDEMIMGKVFEETMTSSMFVSDSLRELFSSSSDNKKKRKKKSKILVDKFQRINLIYHSPHNVLPIYNNFDEVIGYIVIKTKSKRASQSVPDDGYRTLERSTYASNHGKAYNIKASLLSIISKMSNDIYSISDNKDKLKEFQEKFAKLFVTMILKKITETAGVYIDKERIKKLIMDKFMEKFNRMPSDNELMKYLNDEIFAIISKSAGNDLLFVVKKYLSSFGSFKFPYETLTIRFVPSDRMVLFEHPSGDSVISDLIYPAKIYVLTQLANTVSKLSRSATIRKWNLEIGSRTDASTIVNRFRKDISNTVITATDLIRRDIPNIISDFKDLITIRKNGNPFVDVELINFGDPTISTQDLEYQRNEIAAASGIPLQYLGYATDVELREQLVQTNIMFFNEISDIQHSLNISIQELIDKIFYIVDGDKVSDKVKIKLFPPITLLMQIIDQSMQSVTSLVSTLSSDPFNIKVNPIDLLEKMVPYLNWRELKESGVIKVNEDAIENAARSQGEQQPDQQGW